ncbi:dGTPase [Alteromonas pelagimontana]|uniref:dGTPase n=1 Tax=Alteromonas pelagimontana TaxID=1858656 RepID=A0A6M4MF36_9ALTE|nr:dGTPase [Alteromonas pelagimontana]
MNNTITFQCESDRGRIINSAAVRRLQQKTQVFPLERNAAVRSRLTHSLEVMQVGRFIARKLITLLQTEPLYSQDIEGLEQALESLVEMSCLMHDVGNPPFGHFGERAIQDWFDSAIVACSKKALKAADEEGSEDEHASEPESLSKALLNDIIHFEGNAQGIRLITHLQKLNLTKTQIASVLKYTRCGNEKEPEEKSEPHYYKRKKVGFYYSEKIPIDKILSFHKLKQWHRHPIAYIMEAADDISYCIADLEDAVDKNLMTFGQLQVLLNENFRKHYEACDTDCTCSTVKVGWKEVPECKAMETLLGSSKNWSNYDKEDASQFFVAMRANFVSALVSHAADTLFQHLPRILEGSYDKHVLEDDSAYGRLAKAMKDTAFKHVFCHPEVEANELKGYTVITGLLDRYRPLLEATRETFEKALNNDKKVPVLLSRMCKKLPQKHLRAYREALAPEQKNIQRFDSERVMEYYYRCRLIQDLVSGMTDQYALDEYRELMALETF